MVYLITGGAGFVGSNLACLLKEEQPQSRVIALDNLKRRGSEWNLAKLKEHGVEFVHGDIRNNEDLEFEHIDVLIECSAEPSVLAGYGGSPDYLVNTNLMGTLRCLELARKHKAAFLFLSTSRVYPIRPLNNLNFTESAKRFDWSDQQFLPGCSSEGISEIFPLEGTRSLYGATKLSSELIIQEYAEMYDMKAVINRCGVLAGPGQMGKTDQGVVALWVAKHLYQKSLSYIGYGGLGKQVRDMMHVEDLYCLLKIQLQNLDQYSGQIWNVGGGKKGSVSLQELTELCQDITGHHIPITSEMEDRPADLRIFITDSQKVESVSGWTPQIRPQEIVQQIHNWIQQNYESLKPILS